MWLHVDVLCPEEFLGAVARQIFNYVRIDAAAVIALARISLGVLVGEHRTSSLKHSFAYEVLRGDQLQTFMLAIGFLGNRSGNFQIRFRQRTKLAGIHGLSPSILNGNSR